MNRKKYCVANWKMYFTKTNIEYFIKYWKLKPKLQGDVKLVFSPSYIDIPLLQSLVMNTNIDVCSQNISHFVEGAYTGDISYKMIQEYNCKWVIIGHSERRTIFNEMNDIINCKIDLLIKNKFNCILCIGETKEERESNKTFTVLNEQLSILSKFNKNSDFNILIAYEPVWAIGTGLTATEDIISNAHKAIRSILNNYGLHGNNMSILYGGSVNNQNAAKLAKIDDLDGFLVGSASLDVNKFYSIYKEL